MGKKKRLPPGFVYHRIPPKEWVDQLAQLAPPNELHPWLWLAWMSGDPWEEITNQDGRILQYGVQRWVIYEMVPLRVWWGIIQGHRARGKKANEILEVDVLEALQGPHPRDVGYYDDVLDQFISTADVTRQEWELFREHKAVPKIFWIIQGTHGGHKRVYSPLEEKYLGMAGLPTEAPAPGALPYADFDERVMIELAKRDRLHRMTGILSPVDQVRDAQLVEFRRQLVAMVEAQQRAALEEQALNLEGIPRSSAKEDDPTGYIEEAIDRFIQTGSLAPPPKES